MKETSFWHSQVHMGRVKHAEVVIERATERTYGPSVELAPLGDDAKVILGSGGSDAVDAAAKLSRHYWTAIGRPDKRVIVGRH